ncbi:hypothetical protein Tco_0512791, partial [Tanacetum coccineum]
KSDCGDDNTQFDNDKGSTSDHETDENKTGSKSDQEENEEDVEDDCHNPKISEYNGNQRRVTS